MGRKTFCLKLFFQSDKGVAAIEFALIAPILCLLLLGVIDYGIYFNERMRMEDLARATAQYAVQGGDPDDAMTNVAEGSDVYTDAAADGQTITSSAEEVCECAAGVAVACTDTCIDGSYVRHYFQVEMERPYAPLFPYPGIAENLTIRGYSRLQFEGDAN